jgi:hypothetical protein
MHSKYMPGSTIGQFVASLPRVCHFWLACR